MSYRSSSDLKAPPGYRIAHYLIEGRPYLGWVHDNYPLCVFWSPRWRHSDEVVQHMIRWSETPGARLLRPLEPRRLLLSG
jgi:hypothetical protein